jgi:hypothetical protein
MRRNLVGASLLAVSSFSAAPSQLYANVVHSFNIPGIKSRHDGVDVVIVRENTEVRRSATRAAACALFGALCAGRWLGRARPAHPHKQAPRRPRDASNRHFVVPYASGPHGSGDDESLVVAASLLTRPRFPSSIIFP